MRHPSLFISKLIILNYGFAAKVNCGFIQQRQEEKEISLFPVKRVKYLFHRSSDEVLKDPFNNTSLLKGTVYLNNFKEPTNYKVICSIYNGRCKKNFWRCFSPYFCGNWKCTFLIERYVNSSFKVKIFSLELEKNAISDI